jgi:CheY-like chemotaxis protein
MTPDPRPLRVLLVEDDAGDVLLVREAFADSAMATALEVVSDGVEALALLRRAGDHADTPTPDLILLDLNLPRKDGREVLEELKADPALCRIPVIVLTTSAAQTDIMRAYELQANCFITKPLDLDEYFAVVRSIEDFWLATARLPSN